MTAFRIFFLAFITCLFLNEREPMMADYEHSATYRSLTKEALERRLVLNTAILP